MQALGPVLFVLSIPLLLRWVPPKSRLWISDRSRLGRGRGVRRPRRHGAKESRPALDRLVKDARRRKFDVVVTWKLDRLGRNLKHLIIAARRSPGARRRVRQPQRRDRRHDAGGTAADARARGDRGVRARPDRRARAGGAGAGEGAGEAARPAALRRLPTTGSRPSADLSLRDAAAALGVSRSVVHRWRLSRKPLKLGLKTTANSSAISVVAA